MHLLVFIIIDKGVAMKIALECFSCFLKQAVEAAEMSTESETMRREILREVLKESLKISFDRTPVHMGMIIHRIVREKTKNPDPYANLKKKYNARALELYPYMKELVGYSKEKLVTAVKLAIAGNILDFGIGGYAKDFGVKEIIDEVLEQPFAVDNYQNFRKALSKADSILYLADNTGEIVFDRVLIEEIPDYKKRITLVVKESPIINDATLEDAEAVGLADQVRVISSGLEAPGTIIDHCSEDFLDALHSADMIISKGQGNYEGLSDLSLPIFFLLKAKCKVIARNLGVKVGDLILKQDIKS